LIEADQYEIKKRRARGYEAIHMNFLLPGIGSCEIMIMTENDFDLYNYGQLKSLKAVGCLSKPHWSYKLERKLGNINPRQVFEPEKLLLTGDFGANCLESFRSLSDKVEVMVITKSFRGYTKLTVIELPVGSYPIELALHPQLGLSDIGRYHGFQLVRFEISERGKLQFVTVNKHIGEEKALVPGMVLMFSDDKAVSRFPPVTVSSLNYLRAKILVYKTSLTSAAGNKPAVSTSEIRRIVGKADHSTVAKFLRFKGLLNINELYEAVEFGFLDAGEVVRYFLGDERIQS